MGLAAGSSFSETGARKRGSAGGKGRTSLTVAGYSEEIRDFRISLLIWSLSESSVFCNNQGFLQLCEHFPK